MRKDTQKEDRTIVNHFHGVSSSTEDRKNVCGQTDRCVWKIRHERSRNYHEIRGFRGGRALESEVTDPDEVDAVSDEIRRWSSLSEGECQCFVSVEDGILNVEMM